METEYFGSIGFALPSLSPPAFAGRQAFAEGVQDLPARGVGDGRRDTRPGGHGLARPLVQSAGSEPRRIPRHLARLILIMMMY